MPFALPLLLTTQAVAQPLAAPEALTTGPIFTEARPAPPLADDVARGYPIEGKASKRRGYDPAPLWLDRLFASVGARPSYVAREPTIELAPCDARDMRCQQQHDDLARLEPKTSSAGLVASGLGSALGLLFGGKDRALGGGIVFRARGRFIGIVGEW